MSAFDSIRQAPFLFVGAIVAAMAHQTSGADPAAPVKPLVCLGSTRFQHSARIEYAAISPKGQRLYTASELGLFEWNLETGEARSLSEEARPRNTLDISADGSKLVFVGAGIVVWDIERGAPSRLFKKGRGANGATFPADGKGLIECEDGRLEFWPSSGEAELITRCQRFMSPILSPDRKLILVAAAGEQPNEVEIVDATDRKRIATLEAGRAAFGSASNGHDIVRAAVSRDNSKVAIAAENGSIKLWDVRAQNIVATLNPTHGANELHERDYVVLLFSNDGGQLFVGDRTGGIRRWKIETGKELPPLGFHHGSITSLNLAGPDGPLVSTDDDGVIRRWDIKSGNEIEPFRGYTGRLFSQLSSDGKWALLLDSAGRIDIWNLKAQQIKTKICDPGRFKIERAFVQPMFGFTSDDKRVFLAEEKARVTSWDAATGTSLGAFVLSGYSQEVGWLRYCIPAPDAKHLVVNRGRSRVAKIDGSKGNDVWVCQDFGPLSMCFPAAFTPDGKSLVFGLTTYDKVPHDILSGTLELLKLDAANGKLIQRIKLGDKSGGNLSPLGQPQISRDGKTLLIAYGIGVVLEIKVVDLTTGKLLHSYSVTLDNPVMSRDGKRFVGVRFSKEIAIHDIDTGKPVSQMAIGERFVHSFHLTSEDKQAFITAGGGVACIWNLPKATDSSSP